MPASDSVPCAGTPFDIQAMVRPKKALGQHFLTDHNIARKIADALPDKGLPILEIGPGTGMLTQYLREKPTPFLKVIEIDPEAAESLLIQGLILPEQLIQADFLKLRIPDIHAGELQIIGNFPYNISSQIFFKILEHLEQTATVVCMIQREVAQRIASPPGSKDYGILSVLLQTYYHIEYLFTVSEHVFFPPPKVKSGVIRLTRKPVLPDNYNKDLFFRIVKTAFNQRRKMLGNALKSMLLPGKPLNPAFSQKRAEQLSSEDFLTICRGLEG